ncbi:hypothetical protein [Streptomyces sp. F001]|nr:hypothetical protein [Streptomyces sp. F001]
MADGEAARLEFGGESVAAELARQFGAQDRTLSEVEGEIEVGDLAT